MPMHKCMYGWMDVWMGGAIDRFLCFTEISNAESRNRNETCAYRNESSDDKKRISSKKKRWGIKWTSRFLKSNQSFPQRKLNQKNSLFGFSTLIRKIKYAKKKTKDLNRDLIQAKPFY